MLLAGVVVVVGVVVFDRMRTDQISGRKTALQSRNRIMLYHPGTVVCAADLNDETVQLFYFVFIFSLIIACRVISL